MRAARTLGAMGLVLVAGCAPARAGVDGPGIVEQALRAMESADVERWAFVETVVHNGTTIVQRHDPTRSKGRRWILEAVDGREPTDKERERYTNREPASGSGDDTEEGEIRAMISPDSLELLEETPTHLVYRFDPNAEGEEDARFYEHVDATLRIVRAGPHVESVELRAREPFSPAFGVKVREFETVMTYAPVGEQATVLPSSVRVRMVGRAMLFKKIDESVEVRYSDYSLPEVRRSDP